MSRLYRVISGFQTGVDQAAIRAALRCGLVVGGTMPKGYRTESPDGTGWGERHPEFAALYNAVEHDSSDYPPRTHQNVKDSFGTLWVGANDGPGYACTMRYCKIEEVVPIIAVPGETTPRMIAKQIVDRCLWVLNVAGPRESKTPGIGKVAETFLHRVFRCAEELANERAKR